MEMKEAERLVIAKPVASRPSCSGFRTYKGLLTMSVNVSPQKSLPEIVVEAINPKTVRFRPTGNGGASSAFARPGGEVSADDNGNPSDVQRTIDGRNGKSSGDCRTITDRRNYVVYKPKAKVVSKATISLLETMGRVSVGRGALKQTEKVPTFVEPEAHAKSSDTLMGGRSCLDGYNWRKYGQKQVKGSECPRSYYKCTHPNCPVKKKVERSLDGQISEIVYQGEHNHLKPSLPPRRGASSASQKLGLASEGSTRQDPVIYPLWRNELITRNDGSEGRIEKRKGAGVPYEFAVPRAANSAARSSDSCCWSSECDEASKGLDGEFDDPKSKRRKNEHQTSEAGVSEDGSGETIGQTQGSVDSDALEDGFRWRKYGQKVVGGNPFPRSYYRCTTQNCRARKHVERASDDPLSLQPMKGNTTTRCPSGLTFP